MRLTKVSEPDITISPATTDDIQSVVDLDAAITGTEKPGFWYHYFYRQSSRSSSIFLIARVNGKVAGYITGTVRVWEFGSPPAGWIHAIGVAQEYRKLGIGTQLFEKIKQFFVSSGTHTVRTMLHIDDHLMMSFFRFQGLSAGPFIELDMTLEPDATAELAAAPVDTP